MKDFADGHGKQENINRVREALEALPDQMPGVVRNLQVGVNTLENADNYDIILIADFDSMASLEAYFKHPAHLVVAELVRKLREERAAIDF